MKRNIKALAVVAARSGTGKTTLMEAVIKILKARGYRVGAVKHSDHEVSVDREGSDSWRLAKAGSDVTVLAAEGQLAVFRKMGRPSLDDALEAASEGVDIVLVEGFSEMNLPKIEICREGQTDDLYCKSGKYRDPFLVAVASDRAMDLDVPLLDLNDPGKVCDFIVERFMDKKDP